MAKKRKSKSLRRNFLTQISMLLVQKWKIIPFSLVLLQKKLVSLI